MKLYILDWANCRLGDIKQIDVSARPLMSYHLQIKKLSNKQEKEQSIPVEDWLGLINDDDDFSYIIDEGSSVSVIFSTKQNHSESIEWNQGKIDAQKPSEILARKMVVLANKLDAQVVTDKGLCYF